MSNIFIETQTNTEDRLATAFSTEKVTSTTSKYTTQTIQAPAGFTKIGRSPDYVAKRAGIPDTSPGSIPIPLGGKAAVPAQYVQRIRCIKRVPVISTKHTTTTVQGSRKTIKRTKTKTVSTTETVIETEYPDDVMTTVTETSFLTVTEYNDITSTSTMTEFVTVETQVPVELDLACSNDNMITTANGGRSLYGRDYGDYPFYLLDITGMSNAYECCAACMKNPQCLSAATSLADRAKCVHFASTSTKLCPNGQVNWGTYFTASNESPFWIWSNGPCGTWKNGGNWNVRESKDV
ncbi:hypothetical protein FPOAC2_03810 [Fusarium poae]